MGNNLSNEEKTVFSMWKALLKRKNIQASDHAPRSLLIWCKSQDFEADADTAFSVQAWKKVGKRLWGVISKGDETVVDLAAAWRLLYEALKERKAEQDRGEELEEQELELETGVEEQEEDEAQPVDVSPPEEAAAVAVEVPAAFAIMRLKRQAGTVPQYLSPKDGVKPVLVELRVKPKYLTPAQQLAKMKSQKERSETQAGSSALPSLPGLFVPLSPSRGSAAPSLLSLELSTPPLPSFKPSASTSPPGEPSAPRLPPEMVEQMQSLTLCPALSSDSSDDELPVISTPKKTQESVSV